MPESVEAAMEYIKGYCLKHPYCENNGNVCRLYEKATGRCFLCSDMMDYQEAINALKLERISLEGKPRRVADFCEALNVAVSAMQELQQYKQIGTLEEVREAVEKQHPKSGEWRLAEDPPEDSNFVLLSFANFSTPLVGRYEEDEEGGAYYIGDDDEPCTASDVFVDAWMPLPDPYRMDVAKKQTNADRIRSMTDEELLDIILCPYDTAGSPASIMPCVKDGVQQLVAPDDCHKCMMSWLKTEVEDNEDD